MWALRTAWAPSRHGSPGGRWSGSPRGRPRLQREAALTFTARPRRAGRCGHGPERSGARPVCTEGDGDVSAGGGGVKEVMASSSDSQSVVYPFIQEAGGDLHGEARASWASRGGCSGACPPPRGDPMFLTRISHLQISKQRARASPGLRAWDRPPYLVSIFVSIVLCIFS